MNDKADEYRAIADDMILQDHAQSVAMAIIKKARSRKADKAEADCFERVV